MRVYPEVIANEGILYMTQIFKIQASPSDIVSCHTQDITWVKGLTSVQGIKMAYYKPCWHQEEYGLVLTFKDDIQYINKVSEYCWCTPYFVPFVPIELVAGSPRAVGVWFGFMAYQPS